MATPAVPSPIEATTAVCATPNQARRVIKTIDGLVKFKNIINVQKFVTTA